MTPVQRVASPSMVLRCRDGSCMREYRRAEFPHANHGEYRSVPAILAFAGAQVAPAEEGYHNSEGQGYSGDEQRMGEERREPAPTDGSERVRVVAGRRQPP